MAEHKVYFISGMDTDCGKTYITARLAAHLNAIGIKTITQKPVQTGCADVSEDIEEHRKVMGTGWLSERMSFIAFWAMIIEGDAPDMSR